MLTKVQLKQYHTENVPMHVLELDYIQSMVLRHIFVKHEGIAFKGGTSLRMAYGINRFSEDLDFNLIEGDPVQIIETAVKGLERTGIIARAGPHQDRKNVFLATLRYQGPLYSGVPISEGSLELELSKYGVMAETKWMTVLSPYPDVGTFMLRSMAPDEMLAEKVRSLVQRRKPRDLYDIWFLLMKGAVLREDLLSLKMKEVGLQPRSPTEVLDGYDITEKEWLRDMGNLMTRAPHHLMILKDVKESIKRPHSH